MNTTPTRPLDELLEIMRRLRAPGGCPWDREQTLDTLKPFLIEECYELIDAIESGDPSRHEEELGDILLQVIFQTQLRTEAGQFDFDDVARRLAEKLIRRHPHVFAAESVADSADVLRNWEKIKAVEKKRRAQVGRGRRAAPPAVADEGAPGADPRGAGGFRLVGRA